MTDKDKVKTVKEKLTEYLKQLADGGVKYKETMIKQIEAYENEFKAAKDGLAEFEKKLEDIKVYLEYVKKMKE